MYRYKVDHTIDNACTLYLWLMNKRGIIKLDTCLDFRRDISVSLTNPNRDKRNKKEDDNEKVIIDEKEYLLLPLNVSNKSNRKLCFFGSMFNKKVKFPKTSFGCNVCKKKKKIQFYDVQKCKSVQIVYSTYVVQKAKLLNYFATALKYHLY